MQAKVNLEDVMDAMEKRNSQQALLCMHCEADGLLQLPSTPSLCLC